MWLRREADLTVSACVGCSPLNLNPPQRRLDHLATRNSKYFITGSKHHSKTPGKTLVFLATASDLNLHDRPNLQNQLIPFKIRNSFPFPSLFLFFGAK